MEWTDDSFAPQHKMASTTWPYKVISI